MRTAVCSQCKQTFPLRETFQILGHPTCRECGEKFVTGAGEAAEKVEITQNVDPTMCAWCGVDQGDTLLPTAVAELPTCEACETRLTNFPFPLWVKASFAALLLVVVGSFVYNWPYVSALLDSRQAMQALMAGDFVQARQAADQAAAALPRNRDLAGLAALMHGVEELQADHPAEALVHLNLASQSFGPQDELVTGLRFQAEISAAFDRKDYEHMVQAAEGAARHQPQSETWTQARLSALACRFAAQGNAADQQQVEQGLIEYKKQATNAEDFARFENRIRHRLTTREIIDSKEFAERFPNGWTPPPALGT